MENEPKKHHYIPQFILKNFCGEDNLTYYYDNKTKYLQKRNTKNIFMNMNMYRSEEINEENPTIIEKQLAVFEQEISELINKKILHTSEIKLTRSELESLRIFLGLLAFRDDLRKKQYTGSHFNESTKYVLDKAKGVDDYELFWKKEVECISKWRTAEDIQRDEFVDKIIKQDFLNLLQLYYMTFVDARGQDFILSDVYPTTEILPHPFLDAKIDMHEFYPLSPTRALILNYSFFGKRVAETGLGQVFNRSSHIKGNAILQPKVKYVQDGIYSKEDIFTYKIPKIYATEVIYINMLYLNETRIGFIFKDKEKIQKSIYDYENFIQKEYNKNSFNKLLKQLEEE